VPSGRRWSKAGILVSIPTAFPAFENDADEDEHEDDAADEDGEAVRHELHVEDFAYTG